MARIITKTVTTLFSRFLPINIGISDIEAILPEYFMSLIRERFNISDTPNVWDMDASELVKFKETNAELISASKAMALRLSILK